MNNVLMNEADVTTIQTERLYEWISIPVKLCKITRVIVPFQHKKGRI